MEAMRILLFAFTATLMAADLPPTPKPVTVSKEDLLTLQRNSSRIQVLQMRVQMVQAEAQRDAQAMFTEDNEIVARVCKAANLNPKDCDVNQETGIVSKKAVEEAKKPPAQPQPK